VSKKRKAPALTAKTADRHDLYQRSVQAADVEVVFIDKAFKKQRKRKPYTMREDFCGTALLSSAWVTSNTKRTATGVDIDPGVLAWAEKNNLALLAESAQRLTLLEQDVRQPAAEKFDIINAFNFSYWIFKTRPELLHYFKGVHQSLVDDGAFMLDLYGGWEAQQAVKTKRTIKGGFKYVWDQGEIDPITHDVVNHIHFEFKDGSRIKQAFSYEWRFWTLLEVRELLVEAGFSDVVVYWQVDNDYKIYQRCENQPLWLAYLVALK
jgi:hypothetical protein